MSALLLSIGILCGDVIHLKNGGKLEGVIIHDQDGDVVVRLKYATVELEKGEIESIEKKEGPPAAPGAPTARLPRWDRCVEVGKSKTWEGKWSQVPALVVEEGPLKNVPYMSFHSGNYEFNLYGDPDAPAAIELGAYKELLKGDAAKKQCLDAIAELLVNPKDAEVVKTLGLAETKKEREGMVFEITPETAPDAYGGWWVSVYDSAAIEKARATQEELDRITATREEMEKLETQAKEEARKQKETEAKAKAILEKEEADERKRQQEDAAASARQAAQNNASQPYYNDYYGDYWAGWYTWRNWHPGQVRPPHPRPTPHPAPRYYTPGYSRPAGGGYRPGPRVGGIRR